MKTYALLNGTTKTSAELKSTSYEAAVQEFTGQAVGRPFHQARGIRMYRVGGQIVYASAAA